MGWQSMKCAVAYADILAGDGGLASQRALLAVFAGSFAGGGRALALVMAIRPQAQRTALRWAGFLVAVPNCYSEKTRSRKQPFVVTGKLHVTFLRTHELQG